ncbi:acetyl-coenzyme A synthetase, cytoplasmic-like [Lytechinus variegatus]|uniref:acetyl-coenzyme A synthetase, cytoplasmic-like n=1 Tax=Lytechinus variegatus TaxID=7654 RepID=UPI001BB117A3|nr:acetyl-coenzyme A synthetase, cytoplasmic-like [Lytechinus variegatus]
MTRPTRFCQYKPRRVKLPSCKGQASRRAEPCQLSIARAKFSPFIHFDAIMADASGDQATRLYYPNQELQKNAHVKSIEEYKKLYNQSINEPEVFWSKIAEQFYFKTPPTEGKLLEYNFNVNNGPVYIKWFQGATTNVCYNVLDRHVENGLGDRIAFYWEGNDPDDSSKITYGQLLKDVCKFANVLKQHGVKKGDRVAIYMPMIFELVVAMLACARIGAMHSIVFGGFSSDSLAGRMLDAKSSVLVTADGVYRGTKLVNLKQISDDAVKICKKQDFVVEKVFVVRHLGSADISNNGDRSSPVAKRPCYSLTTEYHEGRDLWWHDVMEGASDKCEPVWLEVEEPLFMLYTSGSTGTPKGVVHTQIGYLLYAATTFKYSFDHHKEDIYWCTADIGWITGHSYVCYGPMANAATSVMYEGAPLYPDESRCWQIVDKYNVTILYTAPTLIRTLMKYGEAPVKKYSRKSLRVLATVGEPINPEAWLFYYNVIGDGRCSISDTFWQTETGGHTLTPLPGATPMKPGSATFPFFGIAPAVVNEQGEELEGVCEGYLVFKQPWPGVMRTVYGDHERYERTYFRQFPGYYKTGDGCKRDEDGYFWITGRIDDMFNVSGHLLSTAEIESAIIEHSKVAEAAAVAYPHPTKGEACYCFVTLVEGAEFDNALILELKKLVRTKIGPFAAPEVVHNAPGLPKTRSGKIMRRILRKIAVNDHDLGDVSTMADSTVVDILFKNRPQELLG